MLELTWGAATHTGLRRPRNEDAFLAVHPVFAVADGMGGHEMGEVASRIAIDALRSLTSGGAPEASSHPLTRSMVLDVVRDADAAIGRQAASAARTMGTTVCGLVALREQRGDGLLAFNVGDSRVYQSHHGRLIQLSRDHSVVQELIDTGQLRPEEAERHPDRNVITRSLGSGEPVEIDAWPVVPSAGDRFLICSDGLVKEVPVPTIADHLVRPAPPQQVVDDLIAIALAAGGRDNITVVVVDVVGVAPGPVGDDDAARGPEDTNPRDANGVTTRPRGGDRAQAGGAPIPDNRLGARATVVLPRRTDPPIGSWPEDDRTPLIDEVPRGAEPSAEDGEVMPLAVDEPAGDETPPPSPDRALPEGPA